MFRNLCLAAVIVMALFSCKKQSSTDSTQNQSTFKLDSVYQGGKIFYIDSTGQHGLIVAEGDLSYLDNSGVAQYYFTWLPGPLVYSQTAPINGATGTGIYAGKANTDTLVAQWTFNTNFPAYAAKACHDLVHEGYDDWYLPSQDELYTLSYNIAYNLVHTQFYPGMYWSSTKCVVNGVATGRVREVNIECNNCHNVQVEDVYPWQDFGSGNVISVNRVKAIRSF